MALALIRPHRVLYLWLLALTLVAAALESLTLAAFYAVFQALMALDASAEMVAGILAPVEVLRRGVPLTDPLMASALVVLVLTLSKAAVTLARERLTATASNRVLYDVQQQLMRRFVRAPYQFFLDHQHGALLHTTLVAVRKLGIFALRLPQLAAELAKMLAIGVILLAVWPAAALGLLMVGVSYSVVVRALGRRVSYQIGVERVAVSTEQTTLLSEFFSGLRDITVYGAQRPWLARFERLSRRFCELNVRDLCWLMMPPAILEVVAVLVVVLGLAGLRWGTTGMAAGSNLAALGVFAVALVRLLPSLNTFGRWRMELVGTLPDAEVVFQALTEPMASRRDGTRDITAVRRSIAFERVSFHHHDRGPLLRELTLVIPTGTVTAIVGASGAGKSTLINLLLGLFEPTSGRITIDGVPLADCRLASWLQRVGVVTQEPFVLHGSVAENIIFGRSGVTQEQIASAARVASAHDFISALPQGYDTVIGERGMKLSGGQQQRLAIARAALSNPDVLIFDEATSHLDAAAERQVQDAIERLCEGRTVIVIAHRLSTVRQADKIVVLEEGTIVEEGRHEELTRRQGRYVQLVASGAD